MTDVSVQSGTAPKRRTRARRTGTVVSDKCDKTIKVKYEYIAKHRMYGKYLRRSTTLHAHDEKNEACTGDVVEVTGCRRLSKTKFWRLVRIVERAG